MVTVNKKQQEQQEGYNHEGLKQENENSGKDYDMNLKEHT